MEHGGDARPFILGLTVFLLLAVAAVYAVARLREPSSQEEFRRRQRSLEEHKRKEVSRNFNGPDFMDDFGTLHARKR